MPTIPNIRTSVENQNVLVLDDHARHGTFMRDARNRLIAYAGGFSVVFPYETTDGKKWAFRCWHSDISNSRRRYKTISKAISDSNLDFLCNFEYIDKGINVDGTIYPTIRMKWVDGISIKEYIWQNRHSKELLKKLADNFFEMIHTLHERSLAHGDLQHGNILIDKSQHLYLVDYDSFYCPELKDEPDTVIGLPDYQHPSRLTNRTISEKVDYFSELIIYLSILAIAENPSLAEKYKIQDADRLLFSKDDYKNITNSEIYHDILLLGGSFIELLAILVDYLKHNDINELKPFEICLLENKVQFSSTVTKAIRDTQQIEISWDVPFKSEVSITRINNGEQQVYQSTGTITTTLSESTTYKLIVKTDSGNVITKQLTIEVFDECEIEFSADKYYIFPNIPVILTWNVKHAKAVWLNNENIPLSGEMVVEPSIATTFVIVAEDEFGKKEKRIDIQMLPIPQVKSLLVPAPNFASKLSLSIKQPKLNVDVRFPNINITFIKAEPPKVPSLTDLGIKVNLIRPHKESNLKKILTKLLNFIKG